MPVFHHFTSEFQKELSTAEVVVTAVSVIFLVGEMAFSAAILAGLILYLK